jgi:putative PIN family toxin of toxin-antitoxin system
MSNIVLDTNCLIMAISAKNEYHLVWQSFLRGDYVLYVSNEIIEEYLEVLSRNINPWVAESVIYAILTRKNVKKLVPYYRFGLIEADPDDNKFVDCAIAANAKYIVSEDHHFDVLQSCPFPKVDVIGLDLFTSLLKSKSYIFFENNTTSHLNEPVVDYKR